MGTRGIAWAAATAILVGVGSLATAGVIRHDRDQQAYLSVGQLYPWVGRFDVEGWGSDGWMGSGVLVAEDWVLTAAHMIDGAYSMDYRIGGRTYSADWGEMFPYWTGDLLAGYDIGLVHLSEPVPNVRPAARHYGGGEVGVHATFTGFGKTGTGQTGATKFDGQRRAGHNVLDRLYGQRIFLADFDNPARASDSSYGSSRPVNLEYLIAPGDSGGGVFFNFGRGPELVGINSFGAAFDDNLDSDYGDVSGHTRVSSFNSWIDYTMDLWSWYSLPRGTAAQDARLPQLPLARRISLHESEFVPEPASLMILAAGALVLVGRRCRLAC